MSKATTHKDSQLWGHRKWLCTRNGVWNDQIGFGGMQRTCTPKGSRAHLLGQEHGPLRQLVWVWTGLLPHWDLLGQKVFTLKGRRKWFGETRKNKFMLKAEILLWLQCHQRKSTQLSSRVLKIKHKTKQKTKKQVKSSKIFPCRASLTTALSAVLIMCCVGEAG